MDKAEKYTEKGIQQIQKQVIPILLKVLDSAQIAIDPAQPLATLSN